MSERESSSQRRRRLRSSLRVLMGFIAALALVLALNLPLIRLGYPPCLTVPRTAKWLIARPAAASCVDCHEQTVKVVDRARPEAGPH